MTIDQILSRGVENILPSKEALVDLLQQRKITLYQGFDPTAPSLHIGNFIGLRKLSQFQKLGHKVIFLIGDFTAMVGDPTDKSAARQRLTKHEVQENLKDYKAQASKILNFEGENAAEIKFNSDWLAKLNFEDILELTSNFTVQQFIERDMFQERLKAGKPIHLHEFLYPLMQGYDSLFMDVDLEIGGNDQLFNMLPGRTLLKTLKNKEKYILTMKLLTDPSGKKMGKTEGNVINLSDSGEDIYGKIMALPDSLIEPGFELLTDLALPNKDSMIQKKLLASDLVRQIHGEEASKNAQNHFESTFQNKTPDFSEEIEASGNLATTIAETGMTVSEAKRLISQNAVDVNGSTITDFTYTPQSGDKIKVGKKKFITIK